VGLVHHPGLLADRDAGVEGHASAERRAGADPRLLADRGAVAEQNLGADLDVVVDDDVDPDRAAGPDHHPPLEDRFAGDDPGGLRRPTEHAAGEHLGARTDLHPGADHDVRMDRHPVAEDRALADDGELGDRHALTDRLGLDYCAAVDRGHRAAILALR